MTPKYQDTCTVSYGKQQSSARDAGVRDTDLQLPSACDSACLCTNTLGPKATKALVKATFQNQTASGNYVPGVDSANYDQQYFIQVIVNIIGYCT